MRFKKKKNIFFLKIKIKFLGFLIFWTSTSLANLLHFLPPPLPPFSSLLFAFILYLSTLCYRVCYSPLLFFSPFFYNFFLTLSYSSSPFFPWLRFNPSVRLCPSFFPSFLAPLSFLKLFFKRFSLNLKWLRLFRGVRKVSLRKKIFPTPWGWGKFVVLT